MEWIVDVGDGKERVLRISLFVGMGEAEVGCMDGLKGFFFLVCYRSGYFRSRIYFLCFGCEWGVEMGGDGWFWAWAWDLRFEI